MNTSSSLNFSFPSLWQSTNLLVFSTLWLLTLSSFLQSSNLPLIIISSHPKLPHPTPSKFIPSLLPCSQNLIILIPSETTLSTLQLYIYCILDISTWMAQRHLKPNVSQMQFICPSSPPSWKPCSSPASPSQRWPPSLIQLFQQKTQELAVVPPMPHPSTSTQHKYHQNHL